MPRPARGPRRYVSPYLYLSGWRLRLRFFLQTNFILITAVWLVVVIVVVQSFAGRMGCSDNATSSRSVFGSVPWVVPDFGARR